MVASVPIAFLPLLLFHFFLERLHLGLALALCLLFLPLLVLLPLPQGVHFLILDGIDLILHHHALLCALSTAIGARKHKEPSPIEPH